MHQLSFLYMLNYPAVYSLSESEWAAVLMQGSVFNLVLPDCVNELYSLVWIKLKHPFPHSYQPSRLCVDPGLSPLAFESTAIFLITDKSSVSMGSFPRW